MVSNRSSKVVVIAVLLAAAVLAVAAFEWQRRVELAERAARARQEQAVAVKKAEEAAEQRREKTAKLALERVRTRWDDAVKTALVTSRVSLAGPVSRLQDMRYEAEAIDVPPCLVVARAKLTSSMKRTTEAFLSFMERARFSPDWLLAQKDRRHFEDALQSCTRRVLAT